MWSMPFVGEKGSSCLFLSCLLSLVPLPRSFVWGFWFEMNVTVFVFGSDKLDVAFLTDLLACIVSLHSVRDVDVSLEHLF